MTELCRSLHVLPGPGGLLDQDYRHVMMLKAGLRAFNIKQEYEQKKANRASKSRRSR